jgi:hypothetical protein
MTGWFTAGPSKKRKLSRPIFKLASQSVAWNRTRRKPSPNVKFDFLGYGFRPHWVKNSNSNELFCGFTPAVSATALKAMRTTIRDLKLQEPN